MKKLVLSAILGASLMISSSAFALTSMSADSMKAATGQAGVSIAIDNVLIESYTGSTSYTDDDGVATGYHANGTYVAGAPASVVISDKHTVKNYLALTGYSDFTTDFDNAITGTVAARVTGAQWAAQGGSRALSIDVGRCEALSTGFSGNMGTAVTIGGVVIGLPTLLISTSSDTYSVGVQMTGSANANTTENFITINKGASVTAILGGTVEIAPH